MKYLKITNCPVRGIFKEAKGRKIDWEYYGFNIRVNQVYQKQGEDKEGNYISLFPIYDETRLNLILDEIVKAIEENPIPNDKAEVIDEEESIKIKAELEEVKELSTTTIKVEKTTIETLEAKIAAMETEINTLKSSK